MIYQHPVTSDINGRHDPLFATFILEGIIATFKSYPTLSDPGLFTAMYALFPELLPRTPVSFWFRNPSQILDI